MIGIWMAIGGILVALGVGGLGMLLWTVKGLGIKWDG